jgi:alpha-beta hydrolase superfamily lysophospholipase
MNGQVLSTAAGTVGTLVAALVVALALVILVRAFRSRRLAELGPWHADRVPEELRAADYAAWPSLEELFERERRLVAEVERRLGRADAPTLDRYRPGGSRHPGECNLSFLLQAEEPTCGALLLHGLSDSPYLMRSLAGSLHRDGATVLGLRLPGHGTAPGGLLSTRWQDWVAATAYGVDRLRQRLDDRPLWIVGFSAGATLALQHALETVRRNGRQPAAGLILLAPAVELPWVARFALWHRLLAWLPYFTKFRWQAVKPEYDPCKYGSFPKRAGAELYQLTRRVWSLARALDPRQQGKLPPILAFQSLADDTLVASGIASLLRTIDRADDELVMFDLNRSPELQGLLDDDEELRFPSPSLAAGGSPPFAMTLVSNRETGGGAVEALTWPASCRQLGAVAEARRQQLTERWPDSVYSLSHLALPMAADDPLYGAASEIGAAAPRGERGVLTQPLEDLLRLRWNPFFGYLTRRVAEFLSRRPAV